MRERLHLTGLSRCYIVRMQRGNTIVKLLVAIAVIVFIIKVGLPWWKEKRGEVTTPGTTSAEISCVDGAERASETWGSGLSAFVNPPYDPAAWDQFRSRTENAISAAERKCSCNAESCTTVKSALSELRSLVSDMDNTVSTSGPPPNGIVQRQEQIDNAITSARDLVRQGK